MIWILLIITAAVGVWLLNKHHSGKEQSVNFNEIRKSLRGKKFTVHLRNKDGSTTPNESALIDKLINFGAEVYTLPTDLKNLNLGPDRFLIQGTCWQSQEKSDMSTINHFDLRIIGVAEQIFAAGTFEGSEKNPDRLFISILKWVACPNIITLV